MFHPCFIQAVATRIAKKRGSGPTRLCRCFARPATNSAEAKGSEMPLVLAGDEFRSTFHDEKIEESPKNRGIINHNIERGIE